MAYPVQALTTLLLAFALATAGVRWFIGWLSVRGHVATENARTMHKGQIPQGGGVPVLLSCITATALLWDGDWRMGGLLAVAAGLGALSGANDRAAIGFPIRLAAHAAAAAAAILLLLPGSLVFGGWLPVGLDRAITLVALVWFINLTNFMDGIDGNTGVQTISVALGSLLVFATQIDFPYDRESLANFDGLALALVGAAGGFLVWNWHKARVFLGDAGSIPLGFLMGAMLLHVAVTVSLAPAIILPLYYVTDATRTLVSRFWRGEKVWQAHRVHAYQRAALAAGSHSAVAGRIALGNVVLIVAALISIEMPLVGFLIAGASVATLMNSLEGLAAAPGPFYGGEARVADPAPVEAPPKP